MKNCLVVYNPNSGKQNKTNFVQNLEKILLDHGYLPTVVSTKYSGHATDIVASAHDVDLVISIGGDGTFNEVMVGNFKREKRILVSHLPVGTANDIGAMYGLGRNILKNLKDVLDGEVKKVDICVINDRPFVYVAGLGKFINISYETPRELKKNFGYLAYLIAGLEEFLGQTRQYEIEYEVNGEVHSGKYSFMLISNANRIAGVDNFYKEVKLDDDKFEVLLCDLTTKADILKSLYHLTTKDITKVPGFYFYKASEFKVKFLEPPSKCWCVDGERLESDSKEYHIRIQNGVEILLPKKNISKLFIEGM